MVDDKENLSSEVGYDSFAEIYDVWVDSRSIASGNLDFYVDEYLKAAGPIVELGVGTGRVAIAAAKRGCRIIGVDASKPMLDKCARRAALEGLSDRIQLLHSDFRHFKLTEKAALIAIPFHGIGHLLSVKEIARCLAHIHSQLAQGGKLIFDHIVFDLEKAKHAPNSPRLRCDFEDGNSKKRCLLWSHDKYNFDTQRVKVHAWVETLDAHGEVESRKDFSLEYCWVFPDEFRRLLADSGFRVISSYGNYARHPITVDSREQIWIAEKQ